MGPTKSEWAIFNKCHNVHPFFVRPGTSIYCILNILMIRGTCIDRR